MLPTWLLREVVCPETVPGVFQQLRKMSLSLAPRTESTALLIRPREQSDAFLWSHTGQESGSENRWDWKPVVMIKEAVSDELGETMPGGTVYIHAFI